MTTLKESLVNGRLNKTKTERRPLTAKQRTAVLFDIHQKNRRRYTQQRRLERLLDDPEARVLLAKGCALDLDRSRFPPGRCARTRFAGMPIILSRTQPSTFELILASSYGDYLFLWLTDAATEFSSTSA